ncbi:MAG: FGGY family carbohydrate kinase [Bacteroidota bacterium]
MREPFLLGYDIGSSSIKASLIKADSGALAASAFSPEGEMKIDSPQPGHAEQRPDIWWEHVKTATTKMLSKGNVDPSDIKGIGISYQMHGLVMVDEQLNAIHPSIIWCDSRAVEIGNKAFTDLGQEYCLRRYLNSPGNFTASKLKWVKENRPDVYSRVFKIMLPGDYIALQLTHEPCTTVSGLSEGILWDFESMDIADKLMEYYGFDRGLIPRTVPTFAIQGVLTREAAEALGLTPGIPISYRAGDQPNNALSLNVLNPGEIAATAGTSGVIYGVTGQNVFDERNRVNTFAHVNYTREHPLKGVLLCINGTGIQYHWLKRALLENRYSYREMNEMAAGVEVGSRGLMCFPFGNGAERSLENRDVKGQFVGINFNIHDKSHLIRAAQEGIAFSFRYGLDILKGMGLEMNAIRAGDTNMFQSRVFKEAFVNTCDVDLTIYNTDGSQGAARGAGLGMGYYASPEEAFKGLKAVEELHPYQALSGRYQEKYQVWKENLVDLFKE